MQGAPALLTEKVESTTVQPGATQSRPSGQPWAGDPAPRGPVSYTITWEAVPVKDADGGFRTANRASAQLAGAAAEDVCVIAHAPEQLEYTLKNGLTLHRWYSIPLTRERMEEPDTCEYLMDQLVNSEAMSPMTKFFVAGSFRDGTRVADINAPLWTKLFLSNKENLLYEIDRFGDALQTFADMLRREDTPAITQYLQQAAMRRRELVHEKHTH